MTVEEPAGPDRTPAPCRTSDELPCEVETRLRAVQRPQDPATSQAPRLDSWDAWIRDMSCCPAPTDAEPGIDDAAAGPGAARATACSAAALALAREGLGAALRLRFRGLAPLSHGACELILQLDADSGLSLDERQTLLRIAEESAIQVQREGSRELRVLLRRSRLGSVELAVSGGGGGVVAEQAAASFCSLARIRQLATQIDARLTIRRLDEGSLMVRCRTRWVDGGTGQWAAPR